MRLCITCQKDCPEYQNYCSWQCMVDQAKAEGGIVHTPNGLPVKCIKADRTMLEHEHGDHPDYKYPVEILCVGAVDDDHRHDFELTMEKPPESDDEVRDFFGETHALIYTDGSVALTIYECCYALWSVRTGELIGGSLWKKGEYRLDLNSLRGPSKLS